MVEQVSSLKTSVKYKDTPIGKVPVDWEVVRLGDICEVVRGNTLSRKNKKYSEGVAPSTIPKDITDSRSNVISEEKLRCNERAHNLFVLYVMRSFQHGLDKHRNDIISKRRPKKDMCSLLLPLPPIFEQKGIIEILRTVDEAIEKTKEIIEKTKALHKGMMLEFFSCRTGHERPKKAETSEIPGGLELVMLKGQRSIASILSCIDTEIEQEANYRERLKLLKKGLMHQLLRGKIRVLRT